MKTTRPELGFERLLLALERDLLDVTDHEILAVANELGIKPTMKGSIALLGVTSAAQLRGWGKEPGRRTNESPGGGRTRSTRRSKGDPPSSG